MSLSHNRKRYNWRLKIHHFSPLVFSLVPGRQILLKYRVICLRGKTDPYLVLFASKWVRRQGVSVVIRTAYYVGSYGLFFCMSYVFRCVTVCSETRCLRVSFQWRSRNLIPNLMESQGTVLFQGCIHTFPDTFTAYTYSTCAFNGYNSNICWFLFETY